MTIGRSLARAAQVPAAHSAALHLKRLAQGHRQTSTQALGQGVSAWQGGMAVSTVAAPALGLLETATTRSQETACAVKNGDPHSICICQSFYILGVPHGSCDCPEHESCIRPEYVYSRRKPYMVVTGSCSAESAAVMLPIKRQIVHHGSL